MNGGTCATVSMRDRDNDGSTRGGSALAGMCVRQYLSAAWRGPPPHIFLRTQRSPPCSSSTLCCTSPLYLYINYTLLYVSPHSLSAPVARSPASFHFLGFKGLTHLRLLTPIIILPLLFLGLGLEVMDEEAEMELHALEAVYGDDCRVLQRFPPCVQILLKPRTADQLSQQFVEIVLVIKTIEKYPGKPPEFELGVAKGLDIARQGNLLLQLEAKAAQLVDEPMLVTLSESAVEFLTLNNYPEGDCCFCLDVLLEEEHVEDLSTHHFMKLMSCFHCFHSDCFSTWWNWIPKDGSALCPICRASIHEEDICHVQQLLNSSSKQPEVHNEEESRFFLQLLGKEAARQAQFSRDFEAQKGRDGIFEPRELRLAPPPLVRHLTPLVSLDAMIQDASITSSSQSSAVASTPSFPPFPPKASNKRKKKTQRKPLGSRQAWVVKDDS